MAEELEMGGDAKEGFTEIAENRNMKKAIRIQMAEADSVVFEQISEERMNRDPKSPNKESSKHNKLVHLRGRELLTYCRAPSDGLPIGEDDLDHQIVQICLRAS